MTDKLKILAFSDVHGDTKAITNLRRKAEEENVDLVLICGDFTSFGEEVPAGLVGEFLGIKKPVAIINGNHESNITSQIVADMYGITNLHGRSIKYKNIGIFGCGSANIGPNWLSEDEIMKSLKEGHERIAYLKKKIMVTHVHPEGSSMELGMFPGSESVRRAITMFKPELLVCGHIHEAEGVEELIEGTRVVNVSKKGKIIEI